MLDGLAVLDQTLTAVAGVVVGVPGSVVLLPLPGEGATFGTASPLLLGPNDNDLTVIWKPVGFPLAA